MRLRDGRPPTRRDAIRTDTLGENRDARRLSWPQGDGAQTAGCRGFIKGADMPLAPELRTEIVTLMARALIADFLSDLQLSGHDGQDTSGTKPIENFPVPGTR